MRGKANELGFIHVCVLWQTGPKAASQYRKGSTDHHRYRLRSRGAFERLEPDEGKLSRPVLRGGGGRKAISLPDVRHEVVRTVVCCGSTIDKPAVPSAVVYRHRRGW